MKPAFPTTGKWYYEGVITQSAISSQYFYIGAGCSLYATSGQLSAGCAPDSTQPGYTTGDVIGVAIDNDAMKTSFYKNGVLVKTVSGGGNAIVNGYGGVKWLLNFGQGSIINSTYYAAANGSFRYAPPTGFNAYVTNSTLQTCTPVRKNTMCYTLSQ